MLKQVDPKTLQENVFSMIGDRWLLISAGNGEQCNTMTASWGQLGVLWHKQVATIYIRPHRYTYEFVENNDYFTLSFFDERYRKELNLCGTKSGRDIDKVKECGFTVKTGSGDAPYFDQANLVVVCKKLYSHDINPASFMDDGIMPCYPKKDFHRAYVGEIIEVYQEV